jgi:hypothetical protein
MAGSFIDYIYRLIGQKPLINIAVGKLGGGNKRIICDANTVMQLIFLF